MAQVDPYFLGHRQAEQERHLEDPNTLVMSHLYVQVWGRKPAD
jgi:hypothetical protein